MNENNNNRPNQQEDDGSLSFLAIPQDEGNKHFNCPGNNTAETNKPYVLGLRLYRRSKNQVRRGTLFSED